MAVGRITGPLLAKNLLRDGVDLAFETDLLYLDVNTGRIGIKTSSPQYTLDVNGSTNVTSLRVQTTSTLGKLVIYAQNSTTYATNTVGDLVISAPLDQKVIIGSDALVQGNLHATGNITAEGSVQIGAITGSDTLSLYADIVSNITPQTSSTYDLGAPNLSWGNAYVDTLIAQTLTGPLGKEINITPGLGQAVNINGNVRIYGNNPLGTGPVTENTLYVNMDGSDTNDGGAIDASRACRTIGGALKSPLYKAGTSIKVASGRYLENNPLRLKPFTSVIGSDLRTTVVEPINKTQDLFWVDSGCYVAQMLMANGQSGLLPGTGYTAGTNRGAYATAFPPNYGGEKIYITHSPYIQNCTNQSGPWLNDGTLFQPNQTVQIPEAVGTATWVANTTTLMVTVEEGSISIGQSINAGPTKPGYIDARTLMLANKAFFQEQVIAYIDDKYSYYGYDKVKCARDTGLIVDSLVSDLLFGSNGYTQSNFAGLQYWNQNGYTGNISGELTTTTNAINYVSSLAQKIVQNITTGTRYQNTVTQVTGVVATTAQASAIATDFDVITRILNTGTSGVTDLVNPNGTDVLSTDAQHAADLLQANKAYLQAEAVAYVNSTKTPGFVYDNAKCYRDIGYMVDSVTFDILYGGNRQAIQSGVYYYGFSNTQSAIPTEIPQTTTAYYRIRQIIEQIITDQDVTKSPGNISVQVTNLPSATTTEAVALRSMVDLITEIIGAGPDASITPSPISLIRSANANVLKAVNLLKANKSFIISEVITFIDSTYNTGFAYNSVKCARDTGLIVDSIATDLLYNGTTQSTFAGLQYWNQSTYTGQINTEVTATVAAINYVSDLAQKIIGSNTTGTRYQSTVTQTIGFAFDSAKCSRDTGLIVDALGLDLLFNGRSQATFAGVQYWNHGSYVGAIASEITTTTNAINYVNSLAQKVIVNDVTGGRYQGTATQVINLPAATSTEQAALNTEFSLITNILANGVVGVTDTIVPNGITTSTNINVLHAYASLQANKSYIQAEAVAFVEQTKTPGFVYDHVKCYRDVGYMIDSISFDLLYTGNLQAITSGVYYYGYNGSSTALPNEQAQSVSAYNYLKSIIPSVITGSPVGALQLAVPQVINGTVGTSAEATILQSDIDIITNIITNGPGVAAAPAPIGLTRTSSANVANAVSILHANRNFLQAEVVTFVNNYKAHLNQSLIVADEFGIISNIVKNGTAGVTDIIVPNTKASTSTAFIEAYNILQANKSYIQSEAVAFVNSQNKIFDVSKCTRDTGLIVDAIAQDLLFSTSSQSTFAGLQYWNQQGYTGAISSEITTTTNAITYIRNLAKKVVQGDVSGSRYSTGTQITSNPATTVEANIIGADFDVILNILNTGTAGVTDIIVPNGITFTPDPNKIKAYNLLQANKIYLEQEAVAFVEATKTVGFVYDTVKCARDIGYIVDSVSFDLAYSGNRQAIQSGVYYYGFSGQTAIPGEISNTTLAYNKLRELLPYIIRGSSYPYPLQSSVVQVVSASTGTTAEINTAQASVDLITNIINNGPSVVTVKTPMSLTLSSNTQVVNAATLIEANRSFLVAEVIAYINDPTNFTYDSAKCYRDVGYMVDCVSFDLLHGGNRQAIQAGVYYYNFNGNDTAIPNEIPQTTSAYNHIRNIVGKIVTNTVITPTSGNTATQVILSHPATNTQIQSLYANIDTITNIIINGPSVAATPQPISLSASTTTEVTYAYDLLIANRSFIQQEVVAFIDQFSPGFVYNRAKCRRDIGLVVENLAYDIAFGGNEKSRESGLAYWNGVTSVISGQISQSVDAFTYLGTLAQSVVTNTTATNLLNTYETAPQVFNTNLNGGVVATTLLPKLVNIITNIIQNGPDSAPVRQPGKGPDWGSVSAEVLLQTNKSFIQNEVLNWINNTYPYLEYREDKCYRDTGLIIDAVTQDIVLNANAKSIEAGVSYWTGNKNVIANASYGQLDQTVETVGAINRARDVALQVINNTTVTNAGFRFNSTSCYRDTGLIIDGLAQDLLFGGNSQSTFAGIQYWNHGNYTGNIPQEITTTTAAITYIKSLAENIVQNNTSGIRYSTATQNTSLPQATISEANTIGGKFDVILDILNNGVTGITNTIVPNNINPSGNVNVQKAYNLLQANIDYMKAEAIGFVEANKSFRYDQTKCARDAGLIVDSIMLDLAFPTQYQSQSTFAGLQYWNQGAYTGQIAGELTTTTNAIAYLNYLAQDVVQNIPTGTRYQFDITQQLLPNPADTPQINKIDTEFNLIKNIILTGTSGITDAIESNGVDPSSDVNDQYAYDLLQTNRAYMIAEVIAFVEATKTPSFVYDSTLCARDVGYMIDSVSFDILHGGNRQAIQSGVYYYNFDETSSAIPNEQAQTIAAFQFIKTLCSRLAQNVHINVLQTAVPLVATSTEDAASTAIEPKLFIPAERIISIIKNGPGVVGYKTPISLTPTYDTDKYRAAKILEKNKEFIKAETIAYINEHLSFQYDPVTCARDVGYIVNSVSFDLLYSGNRQSIQSGVYYWGYTLNSTALPKERVATTLAYDYMKTLVNNIVLGTSVATTYQNTVTQVTGLAVATGVEVDALDTNIDLITTIINVGPSAVKAKTPIGQIASNNQFVRNAVTAIKANRQFIQAEVTAYVASTQVNNQQIFLPFYDQGANATLGVIRNFDLIANIIQNGPGVAPTKTDGNGIFISMGLTVDDVKVAPIITNIVSLGNNQYQVDIDQSTVGYGDDQSLYFGQTLVFPLQDEFVPDRWQQRRVNPIGSMGGSLVDGGVVSERSQINSFVYDAFTQVNQGGVGVHITNNGYAQLVSVFTIFCSQSVIAENGGLCSITNSNANFGDLCLVAKGYGKRDFSGYVRNQPVLPYYPNGVYPQNGQVQVYIPDPLLRPHISLVMEVEPPPTFINSAGLPGFLSGNTNIDVLTTGTIDIVGIDTTGFVIGQSFYIIDQYGKKVDANNQPYVKAGTIVSDLGYQRVTLNYPLNSGGGQTGNFNYFNLYSCGNAYYTVLSSTVAPDPITPGTSLLPNNQNVEEAISLNYISTLSQAIISNTPFSGLTTSTQIFDSSLVGGAGAQSFINNSLGIIENILENGPTYAPAETKTGTLPSGAGSAASLLNKNRSYIQDEVIAYVDSTFFNFSYDQVKCARDTGLIIDALAQDLLFRTNSQSTFAGIQYWNQAGYTGAIGQEITTTTNAISYVKGIAQQIVQGITITGYSSGTQITNLTPATPAEATAIAADFNVILGILNGGTAGVTDNIVPNSITSSTNINVVRAYNLLQANKTYIQQEAVAYVESTKTLGFTYDQTLCYRDVGFMVDSVSFDLLYGGNRQAIQSGVYYYGYSSTATSIVGEIPQTIDAYNYISSLTQKIVLGQPITALQKTVAQVTNVTTSTINEVVSVKDLVTNITNIVKNGPDTTISVTSLPITVSPDTNAFNSAKALENNRAFIIAEAIAFVNQTFPSLSYNPTKCARDMGLIVDSVAQDLMFDSYSQSIFSGVQYWNHGAYVGAIAGELTTTTNAINYVKTLAQRVVLRDQTGTRYQTDVKQNTSLTGATGAETATIGADFKIITDILTGTIAISTVTDIIVSNSLIASTSTNVQNAYALLLANRTYIQAEAVAYVESTKTAGFAYNQDKCYRDVGYMIDSVAIDLLYGGNRQAVQSGVYYYSFNKSSTALPGEQTQSVATYDYIRNILPNIIQGIVIGAPKQISVAQVTSGTPGNTEQASLAQAKIDIINNIIIGGPTVASTKRPINLHRSSDANVINAAKAIEANRAFIVAEVIAYTNSKYISYNKAKCRRDVGLIVDALTYDLANGGNYNAVVAGKSYYAQAGTFHIVQLEENVTDPALFPDDAIVTFYQRSYMSASGYLFEYVGAGTNYGALPQRGVKDPIQSKETVQLNNGKVFFTSTDQNGDFRIGTGLVISQATGVLSGRTFTKSLFANLTPFILAIEGI